MEEETLQSSPSKITKSRTTLQKNLQQIDADITQFTNLPIDTPSHDLLAQNIENKFGFIRTLLNAEIASHGMLPNDSLEIEEKIKELKAKFCGSNSLHSVNSETGSDFGSGSGSVCESCLNNDSVDEMSDFEGADHTEMMLYEVVVADAEKVECSDGGKMWWWKMVVVWTMMSAGLMVTYFGMNQHQHQHEKFLTPT
ncbi:hypothetical protein QVD17_31149 [Tagetes erecta]|uniref:DUF7610 domain-containing protein n=1 Tax=Tagetes erecta TaxID=13708 RepID=A0AAD8NP25_TARER|nr:hypothetical protein QVD17_31149 [Tagetes erecta]